MELKFLIGLAVSLMIFFFKLQATTSEYKAYQEQVLSNSAKFAQVNKKKRTIYVHYLLLTLSIECLLIF